MSGQRIARIAVFAGLVGVFGLTPAVNLPALPVPITAQTLAVMLAGLMLVPVEAFLSVSLFVGLVAVGLPLLPGGRGGLAVFSSPSAGFLIGFPFAAAAVALVVLGLRRMSWTRRDRGELAASFIAAVAGGVAVLYVIAIPLGAAIGDIPIGTFARGSLSFIPGDLVKAGAAAMVAASAFRAAPFLRPRVAHTKA